jgi:cobalt-zinc-cadmium efflux system membrane fusion protein
MAIVNAPFRGVVKKVYCNNGQFVEKNQPLLEISGNEIIDIQNEFAEAAANYKRLKSEYERIKSLYDEKVTSEKDFILAESEFKTAMAKYNGLKLKIEVIGFSVSKIENGEFYSSYSINSSIRGYVSKLKTNIGSYIDTQSELLEIINPDMFQIKLSVFARDIMELKKGQSVHFKSANTKDVHFATISSIGVVIDEETKSIECYATLNDKKQTNAIANEFIEAEIVINTETVTALPSNAIIKDENGYFILILNKQENGKYLFDKMEVKTGRQYEGYTEIITPKIEGSILTSGIYNIS